MSMGEIYLRQLYSNPARVFTHKTELQLELVQNIKLVANVNLLKFGIMDCSRELLIRPSDRSAKSQALYWTASDSNLYPMPTSMYSQKQSRFSQSRSISTSSHHSPLTSVDIAHLCHPSFSPGLKYGQHCQPSAPPCKISNFLHNLCLPYISTLGCCQTAHHPLFIGPEDTVHLLLSLWFSSSL